MQLTIIGFGRFGKTLYRLIKDDFDVMLYDKNPNAFNSTILTKRTKKTSNLDEAYTSNTIYYCVPISKFESVLKSHTKYINKEHTLIDVLSVKKHPKEVFKKYFSKNDILLTHPMFGPDSSNGGFSGLPIVLDKELAKQETYNYWKTFFESKGLKVLSMSSEEHDELAARSQGITHFIGRLLEDYKYSPTLIDTNGAKILNSVKEHVTNDTWELFSDLQTYNPYTKKMRMQLGRSYEKVFLKLIPTKVDPKTTTFGIQGGKGSFNEQALFEYLERNSIKEYKIKYLYTTSRVLKHLYMGDIDFGLFAIHNSVGGVVQESIQAMTQYKFKIVEEFFIKISHHLMKLPNVSSDQIDTIIAHPQVIKQCITTLGSKYPEYNKISGKGNLIDTATAAKALSHGQLPSNYAILGALGISSLYGLEVIDNDLQDNQQNYTSFLMCSR